MAASGRHAVYQAGSKWHMPVMSINDYMSCIIESMNIGHVRKLFFCLRSTPFGPLAILWDVKDDRRKICRIIISTPVIKADKAVRQFFPAAVTGSCSEVTDLIDRIDAFFRGEAVKFTLDNIRLNLCAPFQKKVLLAEYAIPRGKVSFYSSIARRLNNPKAARAVGTALATNPFPIVIPCHRAIRSDGTLGGYQGGLEMKHRLLEMEGVEFRDEKHVAERCFY
jgi:methylated-DNA-[protein]-cysteine S-methyltransferase